MAKTADSLVFYVIIPCITVVFKEETLGKDPL